MTVFGIDAQARITNWDNVARSGAQFAIFRCVGEGGVIDPDYAGNVADAQANGVLPGAYHFIAAGTSVDHCKRFVGELENPVGKLVVVDVERPNAHPAPNINDVRRWFDEFRRWHPTHPVLIYSGKWWWAGPQFGNPIGVTLTPYLWSSRYVTGGYPGDDSLHWDQPYGGWQRWTLWQYRGSGPLADGSSAGGAVDLNAFRGPLAALRKLAGIPDPPDTPGDPMIVGGGLTRTSSHVIDLAKGQPLYQTPGGAVLTNLTNSATVEYFGIAASWYAVEVVTAAGFPDGQARPVICYVPRTAGTVRAKPPASPDCSNAIAAERERLRGELHAKVDEVLP